MNIYITLMKDELNHVNVVIYKHGKFMTPILILDDFEFERLIEVYNKRIQEFKKKMRVKKN